MKHLAFAIVPVLYLIAFLTIVSHLAGQASSALVP